MTLVNFYYPGHRGGGAIRSTFNLTERLGQHFYFYVVTADRDFLDDSAYACVRSNQWQRVRAANVFYAGVGDLSLGRLRRLIIDVNPSIIYLNSFFHPVFAIRVLLLQRLGLISKAPVVLAPRGELAAGALAIKAGRNRLRSLPECHLAGVLSGGSCRYSTEFPSRPKHKVPSHSGTGSCRRRRGVRGRTIPHQDQRPAKDRLRLANFREKESTHSNSDLASHSSKNSIRHLRADR